MNYCKRLCYFGFYTNFYIWEITWVQKRKKAKNCQIGISAQKKQQLKKIFK